MISKKNSKKRGKRILKSKKRITGGFPKDTLSTLWTWNLGMFLIKKQKKDNEKSYYWIELNVDDCPEGWKRKFDTPVSYLKPTYDVYNLPYYYKEADEPEEKYLSSDGNGMIGELGYRSYDVKIIFKSGIFKMEVNQTMRDGVTPTWAYSRGGYYYFYNVIRPLEKTTKEEHDTLLKTYMKIVNNDTDDKVTDEEKKQFEEHMEALSNQPEPDSKHRLLVSSLAGPGKFRFVAKFFYTRKNKIFYLKPRYRFIFNIIKLSKNVPTEFKELYEIILNAEKDVNGFFTKIGRATKNYHIWTRCDKVDVWEGMCSYDF